MNSIQDYEQLCGWCKCGYNLEFISKEKEINLEREKVFLLSSAEDFSDFFRTHERKTHTSSGWQTI